MSDYLDKVSVAHKAVSARIEDLRKAAENCHGREKQSLLESTHLIAKQRSLLAKAAMSYSHHDKEYLSESEKKEIGEILFYYDGVRLLD